MFAELGHESFSYSAFLRSNTAVGGPEVHLLHCTRLYSPALYHRDVRSKLSSVYQLSYCNQFLCHISRIRTYLPLDGASLLTTLNFQTALHT